MKIFYSIIAPIAKLIASVKQPDPQLNDMDFKKLKSFIIDGDCLVSRTSWQLSNVFMPGEWKHAAIYFKGYVYEASTKGIRKVSLEEFFFKKDCVGLCRWENSTEYFDEDLTSIAMQFLESKIGKDYDWDLFLSNNDKFCCSELVYYTYCLCFGSFAKRFKPSRYLGKEVIRPTDLWINLIRLGKWT